MTESHESPSSTGHPDWVRGDLLGERLPAHAAALREAGEEYLTLAFRACGAIDAQDYVARITRCEPWVGGSTGSKLLLSVAYGRPDPSLHTDLFVKFSRDFGDDIRDRGRFQMGREVRFALLSRAPDFPIAVPACYFADFHHETGTGILISERVEYGRPPIEPHRVKCMDHALPRPLEHYSALVRALARLAGAHRGGRLPVAVDADFPFDPAELDVGRREPFTPEQLQRRLERYADFAGACPQLLPAEIRAPQFLMRLRKEAPRLLACQAAATAALAARPEYIALCHWNANIDNAWFWCDSQGALQCGLLDWGNVGQMNVAMALWGCLSGAGLPLWREHLDELLALFVDEYRAAGGPELEARVLLRQLTLYALGMGLAWLLDAPAMIAARVRNPASLRDALDPRLLADETARTQLHFLTVFLSLWQRTDVDALLGSLETDHA